MSLPSAEVPKALSSQLRSAANVKDSSGRVVEPPLEFMPISVWSPPGQSAEPPPLKAEELGRKHFEAGRDGDSLFFNAELAASAVSSFLRDSDLKRSDALPVKEALALSFQGAAFVSSCVLLCLFYLELGVDFVLGAGRWLPI